MRKLAIARSLACAAFLIVAANPVRADGTFDARNNWWGDPSGPGGDGSGSGDQLWGDGHVVSGSQWATASGGNALFSPWSTTPNGLEEAPYVGLAPTDGAPIQIENFDQGGKGIGYYNTATYNTDGQYRPNETVSIE